jgi:hypothetical protein
MARWTIKQKFGDHEKRSVMDGPATAEHATAVFEFEMENGSRPRCDSFTVEPRADDADLSPAAAKLRALFTPSKDGKPVASAPVDFAKN